jgi:hypothetical protein
MRRCGKERLYIATTARKACALWCWTVMLNHSTGTLQTGESQQPRFATAKYEMYVQAMSFEANQEVIKHVDTENGEVGLLR